MRSRLPAPTSLSRPGCVIAVVIGALYVIARSTGAGWDIVMLCALVAVLAIAAVWPGLSIGGVRATVQAPQDATVGRALPVQVALTGRARGLRVRVLIDRDHPGDWVHADAPCAGEATLVPEHRGVFSHVVVDVRSSSPLGLIGWSRRMSMQLPRPIEVAPRALTMRNEARRGAEQQAEAQPRSSASGQEVTRGVREYVDGDAIRLVHWPATARTGAVMVRELEGPQRPRLVIVVDLRGQASDAEIAASRALGLVRSALADGTAVALATVEPGGPRFGPAESALEAGRRLARAVPGAPAPVSSAPGVEVRHVRAGALA